MSHSPVANRLVSDGLVPVADGLVPVVNRLAPVADGLVPVADGLVPVADGLVPSKSAQKCRFCARKEGDWHQGERKLASGSATVAFLQITAHASKMQIPHNQIINFYQRAR